MLNDTEKFVIILASSTLLINRLMGQIAHLRKNKLEQSYDNTSRFVRWKKWVEKRIIRRLLRREWSFICMNLNTIPPCKNAMCQVRLIFAQKTPKEPSICFHYVALIFPWNRAWSLIWTNLNNIYPKKPCTKFDWSWASVFWEVDSFTVPNIS